MVTKLQNNLLFFLTRIVSTSNFTLRYFKEDGELVQQQVNLNIFTTNNEITESGVNFDIFIVDCNHYNRRPHLTANIKVT